MRPPLKTAPFLTRADALPLGHVVTLPHKGYAGAKCFLVDLRPGDPLPIWSTDEADAGRWSEEEAERLARLHQMAAAHVAAERWAPPHQPPGPLVKLFRSIARTFAPSHKVYP